PGRRSRRCRRRCCRGTAPAAPRRSRLADASPRTSCVPDDAVPPRLAGAGQVLESDLVDALQADPALPQHLEVELVLLEPLGVVPREREQALQLAVTHVVRLTPLLHLGIAGERSGPLPQDQVTAHRA